MIKRIQELGTKIDGIGMQGHWDLNTPSIEEIEKSIVEYAELGIKVAITELDVSVIPMPWDFSGADVNVKFESGDPTMNPYPEKLPDSIQVKLAERYEAIFKLFFYYFPHQILVFYRISIFFLELWAPVFSFHVKKWPKNLYELVKKIGIEV